MKPEEARIVAHVCGDGWVGTYVERNSLQIVHGRKYHRPRKRYEIGYCNTNENLLNEFAADVRKIYGIKVRKRNGIELVFKSKRVFDRIKELGSGGSFDWFIGLEIMNSNSKVKRYWLRAFFDDEGTVDKMSLRIRVKSMNKNGLKHVQHILENLGLPCNITGPNSDNSWYLTLNKASAKEFSKKIGFNHSKKKVLLKTLLNGSKESRTPVSTL